MCVCVCVCVVSEHMSGKDRGGQRPLHQWQLQSGKTSASLSNLSTPRLSCFVKLGPVFSGAPALGFGVCCAALMSDQQGFLDVRTHCAPQLAALQRDDTLSEWQSVA